MSSYKSLIIIILLATVLRFYKLDSYPVSLSWDEVAIGYNAYSIAKTGKDEYGRYWPFLFKSFNDYKLPGYIYLDAIFIKFLGLSEFSVRLPSALAGTFAVIFIYLLTKELFKELKLKFSIFNFQFSIELTAALMLAISPWHLQLSRAAFEANASLSIVLAGLVLLLFGLRNKFAALFSLPVLGLSIYFYYSPRIFIPLMLTAFFLIYKEEIKKKLKYFLIGTILAFFLSVPILLQSFSPQGFKRVQEVSIFADQSLTESHAEARAKYQLPLENVFLNHRIPIILESLKGYFSHFSSGFLFFGDDPNPRHHSAFHGNFFLIEILLIPLGFWVLFKHKESKTKYFLICFTLIAPIAAAFAKDSPHGLRSLLMLPPLVIISTLSVIQLARIKFAGLLLVGSLSILLTNYLFSYYVLYPLKDNQSWAYGYKEMFTQISKIGNSYDRIIISGHYWKPYIFYLFYNQINPEFYHSVASQESIGKYRFGTTAWDSGGKDFEEDDIERLKTGSTIVVLSPNEFESLENKDKFRNLTSINDFSDKNVVFRIGEWVSNKF